MTATNDTGSRYRRLSLWLDTCGEELAPRPALDRDLDVDVAVVGAGYTGLWTAYYLAAADPSLRIALVEREIAGFGASGRNGGWCSALFPTSREVLARRAGRPAAIALHRTMVETVDEVGRVVAAEGLDVGWVKGGTLTLATGPAQVTRLRAAVQADRDWGLSESDSRWLSAAEVAERVSAAGVLGAAYTPHCARVHPARLVRGLARAVERHGVPVYERTAALRIRPGGAGRPAEVDTSGGRLRAEVVIRATEAYTPGLPGHRRDLAPIYSLMIGTAPLPPPASDRLGWRGAETVTDGRRLIIYAQHTADGRIAFGGRGAPYHFGSRVRPAFDRDDRVFAALERTMREVFPAAGDVPVTHRWGGPLAVPRDWFASVGLDSSSGLGWAGGYIGDGVGTTNLAGRTLADLVLRRDTALTRLAWVGHRSRRWEPEPLRWLGVNAVRWLAAGADAAETRMSRSSRGRAVLDRLPGS